MGGLGYRHCIACGPDNPHGLKLEFQTNKAGVGASWTPEEDWASYPGTVHGGAITMVLDEAMSKAIIAMGSQAFTVDLKVRFHHAVQPGGSYSVRAWVVEKRKRRIRAEANLVSGSGLVHAKAWATFLQKSDIDDYTEQPKSNSVQAQQNLC